MIDMNKNKMGPNHYKVLDPLSLEYAMRPKQVRFPTYKNARESVIVEQAKRKAWVPGANSYKQEFKSKVTGNYLQ